jgi:hypothetical protein
MMVAHRRADAVSKHAIGVFEEAQPGNDGPWPSGHRTNHTPAMRRTTFIGR